MANIKIDEKYECPICKSCILAGKSRQVSEDSCEMWFECAKCGYDTNPRDHVETVMGWQPELKGCAVESWQNCISAWLHGDELESIRVENAKLTRMVDKAVVVIRRNCAECNICEYSNYCSKHITDDDEKCRKDILAYLEDET